MPTEYKSCPFCYSKNVATIEKAQLGSTAVTIIVFCKDCNNKIDVYPKEPT